MAFQLIAIRHKIRLSHDPLSSDIQRLNMARDIHNDSVRSLYLPG